MKKRKGRHLKKYNKTPVQHWPAIMVRAARKAGRLDKLQAAEGEINQLLTAFQVPGVELFKGGGGLSSEVVTRELYQIGRL